MRRYAVVLLIVIMSLQNIPQSELNHTIVEHSSVASKSTGVDLSVTAISYSYPDSVDRQKYQMFSSNYPIPNFNKPESLFVTDAVIDVPITIQVTVQNLGATNSPAVDLTVVTLHNEYQNFELSNQTNVISSVRALDSITSSFTLVPTYSGNHTIVVTPKMSTTDDNPSNDILIETFTVASHYFNCDDLTLWTVGQGWGTNSETALSQGSACHIGNGQSSTYQPNMATDLITPVLDMSDAISNPTRTNGIAFFFTGSVATGDSVKAYSMSQSNSWVELASISGTIDSDISDGGDWQTASINNAGATSPLIPSPQQNFHANSQFRFGFSSDALNQDIGLWIDDIVLIYDQQLRVDEYGIIAQGLNFQGTVPESWGKATIQLTNTGNVSEIFTPSVTGLPNDWQSYFTQTSGVSITESNGIYLEKGETKSIELHFQPNLGTSQGYYPIIFSATSKTHNSVISSLPIQLEVVPDRIPEFLPMMGQTRCVPGSSCVTTASITNSGGASDIFSLSIDYSALPIGWSASFAWNQATEILVQPGYTVPIMLTYTVGSDAVPDSIGLFDLIATSQNDSSRTDTLTVEIIASMVSDAYIYPDITPTLNKNYIAPGDSVSIVFTVRNDASVQDIFDTNVIFDFANDWLISDITPSRLFLNAGDTGTFTAIITAPPTAQVGDDCPTYTGSVISQRSGEIFVSEDIDNLAILQVNNVNIEWVDYPTKLVPGEVNNFSVEITNFGNGALPVEVSLTGIPSSWGVDYYVNQQVSSEIIQLGEISDYTSTITLLIVISIPNGVDHSQVFDIEISVKPAIPGDDIEPDDNSISISLVTDIVRNLTLSSGNIISSIGVGNSTSINLSISNFGNIDETDIQIYASISSDDYFMPITAYLSLGNTGIAYDFNKYHSVIIGKNSSREVRVDMVIPDDIKLGSTIEFNFMLSSVSNEFESLNHKTTLEIDYIRDINIEVSQNNQTMDTSFAYMWVNISTISTTGENYRINLTTPIGWRLICDSVLIAGGVNISSEFTGRTDRFDTIGCEIINEGGPYTGNVNVNIYDESNSLLLSTERRYQFYYDDSDEVGNISPIIVSISGILLAIVVSIGVFLRARRKQYTEIEQQTPMSGPPISGPPISTSIAHEQTIPQAQNNHDNNIPPIPETGLPSGWTMEQWQYYGQQYLDMNNRQ